MAQSMEKLVEELNRYADSYYTDSISLVTDEEYDQKIRTLRQMEQESGYILPDSPTQRIHSDHIDGWKKAQHRTPMLSLRDIYTREELEDWWRTLPDCPDDIYKVSVEPKYDGLSLSLVYSHGTLVRAVTRGEGGIAGDDVTVNAKMITSIPSTLTEWWAQDEHFEVRGEVVMLWESFKSINHRRELANEMPLANPRNAAAGLLRCYDPKRVEEGGLMFYAYYIEDDDDDTQLDHLTQLRTLGFSCPPDDMAYSCDTPDEVLTAIDHIESIREELPYPIDGAVVKANDRTAHAAMGVAGKYPKWGVAYKYQSEKEWTTLRRVVWQVAKSGRVTPVAEFDTVQLHGTKVQRATMNNPQYIMENFPAIAIGDELLIGKGGEIIPKIMSWRHNESVCNLSALVLPPAVCPECGEPLERDGAYLYCRNSECKSRDKKPSRRSAESEAIKQSVAVPSEKLKGKVLQGKKFLVSGNFGTPQARKDIERTVLEQGGVLAKGVTMDVNYYILPDNLEEWKHKAGSKWTKIQGYCHTDRIINAQQFYGMINK